MLSDKEGAREINYLLTRRTNVGDLLEITTSNKAQEQINDEFRQYPSMNNINAEDMIHLNKLGKRILNEIFAPILKKNGVKQSFSELCNNDDYYKHIKEHFGGRWNLMVTNALSNADLFSDEALNFHEKRKRPGF